MNEIRALQGIDTPCWPWFIRKRIEYKRFEKRVSKEHGPHRHAIGQQTKPANQGQGQRDGPRKVNGNRPDRHDPHHFRMPWTLVFLRHQIRGIRQRQGLASIPPLPRLASPTIIALPRQGRRHQGQEHRKTWHPPRSTERESASMDSREPMSSRRDATRVLPPRRPIRRHRNPW